MTTLLAALPASVQPCSRACPVTRTATTTTITTTMTVVAAPTPQLLLALVDTAVQSVWSFARALRALHCVVVL